MTKNLIPWRPEAVLRFSRNWGPGKPAFTNS